MPKDTNAVETTAAHKIFDIPVKLEPGQINTLAFNQDSISQMRQLPEGQLEITMRDGSKIVVENFDELVNSAQSCGRDSIIQLSDNTIIYPEELAAKLAAGPVDFALPTDASGAVLLGAPKAGQISEKNIEAGVEYKLGFELSDTVSAAQAGNNLILTFKDGGVLVLNNYYTAIDSELPPAMTLADGSVIDANALLTSCKLVQVPGTAEAMATRDGQAIPLVEPAAGEEPGQEQLAAAPKRKVSAAPDVEPAAGDENVANIEPAAGDAGNQPASSSRGYGFGSSIDGAALNGKNPVGPIGQTSLLYNAEFPEPRLTAGTPEGFVDTSPLLNGATNAVDETNLGPNTVSGNVGVNYGANGAGSLGLNTTFIAGGSLAGGALTSHGNAVTVALAGNTYTGMANGVVIFTLTLDPATGNYVFNQFGPLDHADGTNPNDLITLTFGVTATDSDGDSVSNTIMIGVYDDAPIAKDDVDTVGPNPLTVTGSVTANDFLGHDGPTPVTQVTFNGTIYSVPAVGSISIVATYGTLTISADGSYSYTSSNTAEGTDQFVYTIVDYDGDPSSATLSITVTDIDTNPTVTPAIGQVDETNLAPTTSVAGSVGANFADDGPGTFAFSTFASGGSQLGGNLTSGGFAVTTSIIGGVYTGIANGATVFTITLDPATGAYIFTQFAALDHADGLDPNDVITLTFGVNAIDSDGDSTPTTITISILDDQPVAVNDSNSVAPGTLAVSGNVLDNDDANNDGHGHVTEVTFAGTTLLVPTVGTVTINGIYGSLTIGSNGAYTYTSYNTMVGTDVFNYTMSDFDGDRASATLTLNVPDVNTCPTIGNETKTTDETDLGPLVVTGKIPTDFGADGPGTIKLTNFEASGFKGGTLSSCGDAITVSLLHSSDSDTYVGVDADGETIFTLKLDLATGNYTYTQYKGMDHADPNNPDDTIVLKFTVTGTDTDGDTGSGVITINVKDDGPVADNDQNSYDTNTGVTSGNVITGLNGGPGADDVLSKDGKNLVTKVTFNGVDYPVPASGEATINGLHGVLKIKADGSYTYTYNGPANITGEVKDQFTYTLTDCDGDSDTALLVITGRDLIDDQPIIKVNPDANAVDETNFAPSGSQTVGGTVTANFGNDGPGTITLTGASSFTYSGSTAATLTSNGVAIVVTQVGNQYIGKAGSETVFTLTLNTDGTYSYTQSGPFDHADANNHNDMITLNFGVTATDTDGDTANAAITINVYDDGPVAVNDTNVVDSAPGSVSGNVTSNDKVGEDTPGYVVKQVTFNGVVYTIPTTGSITINGAHGTLTIDKSGAYTYAATSAGTDQFDYQIVDRDGDKANACLTVTVNDVDTCPTVQNALKVVDETALDDSGTQTVNGTLVIDYKADGPGTVTPSGAGTFNASGSVAGGTLKSNGSLVTVTLVGDTYTGKSADGRTVFTLQVKTDGTYTFKLFDQIDHADVNNPDDIINLNFGFTATDTDGDTASGNITIQVKDDGPVAVNDFNTVGSAPGTASGNVLTNDDAGADEPAIVKYVTYNGVTIGVPSSGTISITGAHGTLTIDKTGAYTYTATSAGVDQFGYGIVDYDGDKSAACLTITVNDIDTCPTVENVTRIVDETDLNNSGTQTLTGTVTVNYGADGPGTVTPSGAGSFNATGSVAGGALTSNGFAVTVTLAGDTYTGKSSDGRTIFTLQVKTDGTYTFKLIDQLDHADKTNPDDIINLNFGFTAKDTDDDTATGRITVQVKDDGPVAADDTNSVSSAPGSVSANVLVNDKSGADAPAIVKQVSFGGTTVDVPASGTVTITGAHGTLTIAANGSYTYNATSVGSDVFTYKIVDFDGDPATAKLTLTVTDIDTVPCIENSLKVVDETGLPSGTQTVNGTLVVDYVADGPGTVTPAGAGTFNATGSIAGGVLTSKGSLITVTLSGDTYTGTAADGRVIFTLQVKPDATYAFKLFDQVDHADKTNPDDVITLNFGVLATDTDGDSAAAKVIIQVKDDGPVAVDDVNSTSDVPATVSGNILANDKFGADEPGALIKIAFGGTVVNIPTTGSIVIDGAHGKLTISANGSYTYQATSAGVDQFTYTIVDFDGDPATAKLTITVNDLDTCPTVENSLKVVDETALDDTGTQTVNGNLVVDYKADGPGSTSPTSASSFTATGSVATGSLKSNGFAVTVTLVGDTYTGTSADGRVIFTLQVKPDATYTFKLFDQIDHANTSNPDDVIALNFGFQATDSDGDSATGKITINVHDDGPVAVNDTNTLPQAPGSVGGNVLSNDDVGADKPGFVKTITFGGTTLDVPSTGTVTINGAYGTLTIAANGTYTYTGSAVGVDQFTYKLVDSDGDPATAKLTITVIDCDETPTVQNVKVVLDETNLTMTGISISGTTSPNFFGDGPGTVKATGVGTFNAGGSLKDGVLKSDGVLIAVTLNAATNTYEGYAGVRKVFDIKVNADGTFTFTQFDNIDHGNPSNTNEEITLQFGVTATDSDGDIATGTITVGILDDAPIARDDYYGMTQGQVVQSGNVLTNDTIGNDYTANAVTAIKLGGTTYSVPNGGSTTVVGTFGTLVINSNGTYTYTAKVGAQGLEVFTYTITDTDLDTSTAQLKFDVKNCNPPEPPVVCADDVCVLEDSCVAVYVTATHVGGSGNEVMTLSISGFKSGWTVDTSMSGGTYNSATGIWSITLAPGQNYAGGPVIYPPHDSDADLNNLVVKATTYDPDSGMTSTAAQDTFNVYTDAVADMPLLNVDGDDTLTNVANLYISTGVADTDGSEVIKEVQITGVPAGFTLTNGTYNPVTGVWTLTVDQLAGLKLIAPHGTIDVVDLTVTSVAIEKNFSGVEKYTYNNTATHTKILTVSFADTCGCGDVMAQMENMVAPDAHTLSHSQKIGVIEAPILIAGFDPGEGDVIDMSAMIETFDPVTQAINDFVFARTEGTTTVISVDQHGSGAASQGQDVVVLQDVTGVKVEDVTVIFVNQNNTTVV